MKNEGNALIIKFTKTGKGEAGTFSPFISFLQYSISLASENVIDKNP